MPHLEVPFLVSVKEVLLVTPSKPTPNLILPLSTVDSQYDHDVPAYSVRVYKGRFDCKLNPADVLKHALSQTLVYYYPLAGKLRRHEHGRLYVHCNAVGVPFVLASANCKLSDVDHIDGVDVGYAKDLVYDFPPEDETGIHSMVLQVTTFLCGGFTIGMGTWHAICDGAGAVQIFNALTELAGGMSTEPSVMPVWERDRLNGSLLKEPVQLPMDPAAAAVSPYLPTTDLVFQSFHIDSNSLRNLKVRLMKESGDPTVKESSCTTYEALSGYIWRSKCKALKLNFEGETLLWIGVGIRKRMHPPLPVGYYGNAYVSAHHVMKVKDLVGGSLFSVVKRIKELKQHACSNTEFMRSSLSRSETERQLGIHPETYEGGVTDIVDWRQLGTVQEMEFGWGRPVNLVTAAKDMLDDVDICIIAPPSSLQASNGDGVRVFVILPTACMGRFKEELDALRSDSHAMNNKLIS